MHTGFFWEAVYWLSLPVLAMLAIILLWRGLAARFPLFFAFVAINPFVDASRLVVFLTYGGRTNAYYYVYWTSEFLRVALALLAACELVLKRLFPGFHRVRFYRYLLVFAALIVGFLVLVTANSTPK